MKKRRPTDALTENLQDLKRAAQQKPPKPEITERKLEFSPGSASTQRQVGERLCPEGFIYAGSLAVHLYKKKDSIDAQILTQVTDFSFIPEAFAQQAVKELTYAVMARYGRKAPASVGKPEPQFEGGTSGLITSP